MEDSGTETDRSGTATGGNLTETSGTIPQSADKKFGTYSRDFEAAESEYLTHNDGLATDISGADAKLSIVGWVKPESYSNFPTIASKYQANAGGRQYRLNLNSTSGEPALSLSADSSSGDAAEAIVYPTAIPLNEWHHVAGVYNDINMNIYVDGTPMSPVAKTDGIFNSTRGFVIGAYAGTGFFDGLIDDVGIFSRDLSSTEINDIMDNGLSPSSVVPSIISIENATINQASFFLN